MAHGPHLIQKRQDAGVQNYKPTQTAFMFHLVDFWQKEWGADKMERSVFEYTTKIEMIENAEQQLQSSCFSFKYILKYT